MYNKYFRIENLSPANGLTWTLSSTDVFARHSHFLLINKSYFVQNWLVIYLIADEDFSLRSDMIVIFDLGHWFLN